MVKYCRIGDTRIKFILVTAVGDSMNVPGIHEAQVKLGRQIFHHVVLVASITDDLLLGLDLMEQHKFQLENRVIKTEQNEIVMTTPKQSLRTGKVTLQEDVDLPARSETIDLLGCRNRFKLTSASRTEL